MAHPIARRILKLRRMGVLGTGSFPGQIERALTIPDIHAAYRLIHDEFVDQGFIRALPWSMRIRIYEVLAECATFVAKVEGDVVGVMGVVLDLAGIGLPSDGAFKAEVDLLRSQGKRICSSINMAVRKEYRGGSLVFELIQACFAQAVAWQCDNAIMALSPSHVHFFCDVLQFQVFAEQRSYSTEVHDPVVLLTADFRTLEESYREVDLLLGEEAFLHDTCFELNPFYNKVVLWTTEATELFRDPSFLRKLLTRTSDFKSSLRPPELAALRLHWGEELFNAVFEVGCDEACSAMRWFT
jgi:hypothetical protein